MSPRKKTQSYTNQQMTHNHFPCHIAEYIFGFGACVIGHLMLVPIRDIGLYLLILEKGTLIVLE
jgi:hypothetical protein